MAGLAVTAATWSSWPPMAAVMAGLITAVGVGAGTQRNVGKVPLSPFIVTLGMWGALRGAAKGVGENDPIWTDGNTWIHRLMQNGDEGLSRLLAPGVWILLALAIGMSIVLQYSRFGRHVYAVGSNELTARLCGVHVGLTKILVYAIAAGSAV